MGCLQLRFGGLHLGLRGLHFAFCLIEIRARDPTLGQERLLPLEMIGYLNELRLGRGEIGPRSAQRVHFVGGIETSDDLAGLDLVANPDDA